MIMNCQIRGFHEPVLDYSLFFLVALLGWCSGMSPREHEDYAYWEIIWNYRLGFSGFGKMLSKDGWVVAREDERR